MKFAIALENTPKSIELLKKFFDKMDFCKGYSLDVYTVKEFEEEDEEIKELEELVKKELKERGIKGEFVVETGEPVERVSILVESRQPDILVASYEHSVFSNTFFEQIIKKVEVPVLVIK